MPKRKPLDPNYVRRQSSRQVQVPQKFVAAPAKRNKISNYWNLSQKQSLLKALKRLSEQSQQPTILTQPQYKFFHKHVKTKSIEQIRSYIDSLTKSMPNNQDDDNAPIQFWNELSEDLADTTGLDCTLDISKMLSTASHEKCDSFSVSFRSLYHFLDALFRGQDLPELSNIDSLVILDCLDNLADFLDNLDTSKQADFMTNENEKLQSFLYSDEDFIIETQMCGEVPDEEGCSQENNHPDSSNNSQTTTQEKDSQSNSAGNNQKRIKLSLSSLNPFGVPVAMLNFEKPVESS